VFSGQLTVGQVNGQFVIDLWSSFRFFEFTTLGACGVKTERVSDDRNVLLWIDGGDTASFLLQRRESTAWRQLPVGFAFVDAH